MRFYIVDVFAESRLSGNQLAVFRDCANLPTDRMQRIAQEMHFSESTFITSEDPKDGYDVRIFTTTSELPFAGHPTLGTAFIIQSEIIRAPVETVTLNLKIGKIPVTFSNDEESQAILWMRQKPPVFGRTFSKDRIAKILGLTTSDVDSKFPVEEVSTGIPFIIVPLTSLKAIRAIRVDQPSMMRLFADSKSTLLFVFCPETYSRENQLNARGLGTADTVLEDPATGSANGCLAAYLVKHRYFGKDDISVRVEQGYEMDRRSILLLRSKKTEKGIEVNVGGKVQFVAKGDFPD